MICIVDFGIGNFGSLLNMFRRIGSNTIVSSNINDIKRAEKLVLPGVGSFSSGAFSLNSKIDLKNELINLVKNKRKPILGICLGMQLLLDKSEEGEGEGLGLIRGHSKRFIFDKNTKLKIPHMGWNKISLNNKSHHLKSCVNSKFYFVHSYHVQPENSKHIICYTNYGKNFASVIGKKNILGCQFHPEKSHHFGIKFLEEFVYNDWFF